MKNPVELRLVLRPAKGETPFRVDVWNRRKWQSRIEVDLANGRGGPWCTIRVDDSTVPPWLEHLAAAARRYHADRLLCSGEQALARGRPERAVRDFDAARTLAADRWEYWEAGARGRIALRRAEEAFELCLQALELDSTEHRAWQCLADILELQNRLREARHALQQALTRAPSDGSTAEELTARTAKLDLRLQEQEARLDSRQPNLPLG